jgi:glycosyltransferase involved in cell wall biosynthesis
MTFSLLVPCYNAAGFLPRLWATVRAQTRSFDEFICYDDASTDDTARVAESLGATVIRGERNGGPARARNALWHAAHGDWVHFHDADDLLRPEFLEKMSRLANENVDVVVCAARWQHPDGALERDWHYADAPLRASPVDYVLEHPIGGINGLYRPAALARVGGFDETLAVWEDADLHVRLAASGARFRAIEEVLVVACRRPDSQSAELKRNWRSRLAALEAYRQMLPERFHATLASEVEKTADQLLGLGDRAGARDAIALGAQLGRRVPTTRNPMLRALRPFVSPVTLLALQRYWRNS